MGFSSLARKGDLDAESEEARRSSKRWVPDVGVPFEAQSRWENDSRTRSDSSMPVDGNRISALGRGVSGHLLFFLFANGFIVENNYLAF